MNDLLVQIIVVAVVANIALIVGALAYTRLRRDREALEEGVAHAGLSSNGGIQASAPSRMSVSGSSASAVGPYAAASPYEATRLAREDRPGGEAAPPARGIETTWSPATEATDAAPPGSPGPAYWTAEPEPEQEEEPEQGPEAEQEPGAEEEPEPAATPVAEPEPQQMPEPAATPVAETSLLDPATGLATATAWSEVFRHEDARLDRYGHPVTIVALELHRLDDLAERFGQETADRLIPAVAATIQRSARSSDLVARQSHSRFMVLMPETDEIRAINFVERVRDACDTWLEASAVSIRLAIGWASAGPGGDLDDALRLAIERMQADRSAGLSPDPRRRYVGR